MKSTEDLIPSPYFSNVDYWGECLKWARSWTHSRSRAFGTSTSSYASAGNSSSPLISLVRGKPILFGVVAIIVYNRKEEVVYSMIHGYHDWIVSTIENNPI